MGADGGLTLAVAMALVFALTNGFHDAANSIATLVATRTARPLPAVAMASVFNLIGPLLLGAAVADTIAGIVQVPPAEATAVIGAGLTGAVAWNVWTWLRGLPASSSHALVGGLAGAAIATAGLDAVAWGPLNAQGHLSGVLGVLVGLLVATVAGFVVGLVLERVALRALARATTRAAGPVRGAQWVASAWLAFSHGANDAQKAVGVMGALFVAAGRTTTLEVPIPLVLAAAAMMTVGTALGGWSIVRTVGRRIFPLHVIDGLVSQTSSASIIITASIVGAPVSTSQVVSSSIVGIGGGRSRWRHVSWAIVRDILIAWITTMPAAAIAAIATLPLWRYIAGG